MGRLVLVMMLAGCWGSTSAPPPHDPIRLPVQTPPIVKTHRRVEISRCVRAIDNALEKFRPELDKIPGMSAREQLLRDAAILGCETTAWTDEVTTCFETAVDLPALNGCRAKLTSDQMRDLNERMSNVMNVAVP